MSEKPVLVTFSIHVGEREFTLTLAMEPWRIYADAYGLFVGTQAFTFPMEQIVNHQKERSADAEESAFEPGVSVTLKGISKSSPDYASMLKLFVEDSQADRSKEHWPHWVE